MQQEKDFAQHFVSSSRQVAQVCEAKRRKLEERQVFAKVRTAVGTARNQSQEAKARHKNTVKKIGRTNQSDAKHARELVEQKRDYQKTKHEEMMERIRNWKHEERAILQQINELRKLTRVAYPNGAPALETDEAQGAAFCIGMFVGDNVGLVEAQLLVDIIASVL
jgi:pyridoxal biosynthesis lyase PdxS